MATGHTLLDDWAKAGGCKDRDIMAVNHAGIFLPRMDHWFSCHSTIFPRWKDAREVCSPSRVWWDECTEPHSIRDEEKFITHGKQGGQADVLWPINGRYGMISGSSAAIVALTLGYDDVLLVGMPEDSGGHFYPEAWDEHTTDHSGMGGKAGWIALRDGFFAGQVKSLSGNTKEWLS